MKQDEAGEHSASSPLVFNFQTQEYQASFLSSYPCSTHCQFPLLSPPPLQRFIYFLLSFLITSILL